MWPLQKVMCCINIFIPASGLPEWVTHKRWDGEKSGCAWARLPVDIIIRDSWTTKLKLVRQRKDGKEQRGNMDLERRRKVRLRGQKRVMSDYDDWSWLLEKVVMVLMEHSQDKNHHDCYSVIIHWHAWHPEPVWFSFWNTKGDISLNFLAVLFHTVV